MGAHGVDGKVVVERLKVAYLTFKNQLSEDDLVVQHGEDKVLVLMRDFGIEDQCGVFWE